MDWREEGPTEPAREDARLLAALPLPRSTEFAREAAVEEATEPARELAVDRAANGTRPSILGGSERGVARLVAVAELEREEGPREEDAPPLIAALRR